MLKKLWLIALLIATLPAMAADAADEGGNLFRESGKIYVVISVILIIFLGIIVYLVSLDRKVSKLEKDLRNKQ